MKVALHASGEPTRRAAPPRVDPFELTPPNDPDPDADVYSFDDTRPAPVEDVADEVPPADMEWAAHVATARMSRSREGASFIRLAQDVFLIPVLRGQFLHEDRHVDDIPDAEAQGMSDHSWNLVVRGSEDQLLLCEVARDIYEHVALREGAFVYFNTHNRHILSRKSAADVVVIAQVGGYGPDGRDAAISRLAQVLAARPSAQRE